MKKYNIIFKKIDIKQSSIINTSPRIQQNNLLNPDIDSSSYINKNEFLSQKGSNHNLSRFVQPQQKRRQHGLYISNIANEDCKSITQTESRRKITHLENNDLNEKQNNPKTVWLKGWIKIIFIISKIKKIAYKTSIFFHPHLLNKIQVNLIGDKASNNQYTKSSNFNRKYELGEQFQYYRFSKYVSFRNYRKIVKFILKNFGWLFILIPKTKQFYQGALQTIFSKFPLFHYLSGFYIIWETIIFLCTALIFLYIPLEFSFELDRNQFFRLYLQLICPIVFGVDIFIRANTKSIENGGLIDNHATIFHKYLKSGMIPDIISLLSLNYQFFGMRGSYFLFFIRIVKSFRVIHLFREQFLLKIRVSGIISLMILLAQLLYFAHIVCCFWYGLGKHQLQYKQGWIEKYDIENYPIEIKYLRSFYYSVITMTTIGYGDITPQTDSERMIVIFIAFISCGVFGYSINSIEVFYKFLLRIINSLFIGFQILTLCIQTVHISLLENPIQIQFQYIHLTWYFKNKGNILSVFKTRNDLYLQEIAKLNKYFKQYKVDLDLQARSRQYLDLIYSDKKEEAISTIDTLSNLSDYLQNEIKVNVFMKRMKEVSFFREIFTNEILEQIALKMKEQIYSPKQDIIDTNEIQEPMIYIIHSGAVKKYATKSQNRNIQEIKTFYEGQIFGFDNFVKGSYESDFNYKSHGISSIIQIPLGQFIDIIKTNEEIHEKFIFYKDQLLYNQNYDVGNLSCDSCRNKFHDLKSCPFIFYQGKKEIIMRKYFQELDKIIKNFKRFQPKLCFNSLLNQRDVEKSIETYNKNQLYISDDDTNSLQLEEEGGEEEDDDNDDAQKIFENQNSNKEDSSILKPFDKSSHKDSSNSYKHNFYEDQINNILTNNQPKSERTTNKSPKFVYQKSPQRMTTDDGLLGADSEIAKNQRQSTVNSLNQQLPVIENLMHKSPSYEHNEGSPKMNKFQLSVLYLIIMIK